VLASVSQASREVLENITMPITPFFNEEMIAEGMA
jgi:hypothetical protein